MDTTTTQADLATLEKGIEGATLRMHNRDFNAAAQAAGLLGKDTLAETVKSEWTALSEDEQTAILNSGNFGKYGIFDLYDSQKHPELIPALRVHQFNLIAASNEPPSFPAITPSEKAALISSLKDPEILDAMKTRFPETMGNADLEEARMAFGIYY
jgi:hypothetical protein